MKWVITLGLSAGLVFCASAASAGPQEDLKAYQGYFAKKFPDVPFADYVNGVYAIDKPSREQWEAIEEFPPYELALEQGERLFNTPFKNGKSYADCFENGGIGIRHQYPYFDTKSGQVKTLELEINECRQSNGEKPLKYKKGAIAAVSAYMAYTSRGKIFDIKIPDDPRALAAYEDGKKFYYAKRGQLNFSCANCHVGSSGQKVRADMLSPGIGQVTHFPVYRSKWGAMGTLHRRYGGCNGQVRAKGFKAQGSEYRNLEYFHTYMSNGLPVNGPGARK
jgi:L-cysteine S-thiosulfotransferase